MSNLSREDLELIDAMIAARLKQIRMPAARDGVVIGGYDPQEGTARVRYADTALMFSDTSDQTIDHPEIPLATTQIGDQTGPRGNERVILLETQGGPVALYVHGEDDAPGAPAGERWIAHRSADGVVDSYTKYANDGPTANDGLGGLLSNGGALHQSSTSGGHSVRLDDTAKTVTVKSAGGLSSTYNDTNEQIKHTAGTVYTLYDGAGNALSHVANHIGVGDLYANLAATNSALNNSHLTQFESDLLTKRLDDLTKFAAAMVSAGVPNAGAVIAQLAALLHVPVPAGSAITRIK